LLRSVWFQSSALLVMTILYCTELHNDDVSFL
jgi:hypothetical protein